MNDEQYIVGQIARITHMANAEDQWLVGRVGRIAGQSVINDEIASVLIAIEDTDEFVNAADFEVLTVEGLLLELEAATDTIAVLQQSLRNIHMTAEKVNGTDWEYAADWIESESGRVLKKLAVEYP